MMRRRTTILMFLLAVMAWGTVKQEVYVVKSGDTLGDIVWTLRAQGISVTRIGEWNPELGTRVVVGQKIAYYLPEVQVPTPQISKADMEKVVRVAIDAIANRVDAAEKQRTDTTRRESEKVRRLAYAGIAVAVLIVAIAFGVFRRRASRKSTELVLAKIIPIRSFSKMLDGIPVDPTLAQLNKYDHFPISIYVTLEKEQVVVPAVVALHDNDHSIVIRFGDGQYVAYDKRRREAARWVAQQPSESLISAKAAL
jgi:LysM domain